MSPAKGKCKCNNNPSFTAKYFLVEGFVCAATCSVLINVSAYQRDLIYIGNFCVTKCMMVMLIVVFLEPSVPVKGL